MGDGGKKALRSRPSLDPKLGNMLIAALAAATFAYGAYGVWHNDLDVPMVGTRRAWPHHFHGASAWLVFAGLLCLSAAIMIFVIRRLGTPPNERADRGVVVPLGIAGIVIVTVMQFMDDLGLA
jgi:hypothetical protein